MEVPSLSATAIQVFQACPARFAAENVERSKGFGSTAASTGSAVHGGLERYVKAVYIDKTHEASLDLLIDLYKISYIEIFNTSDFSTEEYLDGEEMTKTWFERTDVGTVEEVISVEIKEHFFIPTTIGDIQFNYIWDRFDYLGNGVYRVVDYKTNRWGLRSSDLRNKIQARCYALACAIKLKQMKLPYERIWVQFDMLRHDPVGISFNHDDNVATWNFLTSTAQRVVDMPIEEAPERLNPECLFCVRKAECGQLKKNISVGGLHSLDLTKAIDMRALLEWQKKGIEALQRELDNKILSEARVMDLEEVITPDTIMKVGISTRRKVDPDNVERTIGPKLWEKYGSAAITMASIDKLLKGRELSDDQKSQLRSLIYLERGAPSVKVTPRNPIDED